jgi:hypothetical protein
VAADNADDDELGTDLMNQFQSYVIYGQNTNKAK